MLCISHIAHNSNVYFHTNFINKVPLDKTGEEQKYKGFGWRAAPVLLLVVVASSFLAE